MKKGYQPATMEDIKMLMDIMDKRREVYEDVHKLVEIAQEEIDNCNEMVKMLIDDNEALERRIEELENKNVK